MVIKSKDKIKIKIADLLRAHPEGLTIQEIIAKTSLSRHTVLARLHNLIGSGKVGVRQINMAKLHKWVDEEEKNNKKNNVKIVTLEEKHIKKNSKKLKNNLSAKDIFKIKKDIEEELRTGKIKKNAAKFKEEREIIKRSIGEDMQKVKRDVNRRKNRKYIETGINGLDELFINGIPAGNTLIVAGGAGSGKTILCLQIMAYQAKQGKKCLYMSFEESEDRLIEHMEDFQWNPKNLIKSKRLKIQRFNPFDITRNVDALLAKQKGELLIDVDPIIIPKGFKPDFIVVDSLTAIASAFTGKDESYRIYIEQLFRFFEQIGATTFLITETEQIPKIFSKTGVEEFLADGVLVLYNIRQGNVRENAIEVLKLRGAEHLKKIVAMKITDSGIVVYSDQEVFEDIG